MFENTPNEEEEYLLDEVSGRKRKTVMSALNKSRISKHEMDELFYLEL
jgi:hypothetical protein